MFGTKIFILGFSFVVLINVRPSWGMSEEMKELAEMLHNACQDETGVAEDHIVNARKGEFPEDPKLKCYMFCILSQMAVIDDDGTIDEDGAIAVMPDEMKDKAEATIRGCGTKKGVDPCDNAFQSNKCWYTSSPENYFLP